MAKSVKLKPDNAKQSQQFIETAHALEADESSHAFGQAIGALLPVRQTKTAPKKSGRIVQRKRPG